MYNFTSYFFKEEKEAQAKADKIKLALEKLKEAKVKKVGAFIYLFLNLMILKC